MHPISLAAEKLGELFDWLPVTNTLLTTWGVMAILVGISFLATRRLSVVPSGLQNVFEVIIEGALGIIEGITGSYKQAKEFFPIVFTLFIFVLFCNWLGLIPGVGSVGVFEVENGHEAFVPLFRAGSSDISFTLALGIITMIWVQATGVKHLKWNYLGKFFNFRNGAIMFFVGLLELVLEFAKIISFSFRLFGNVFAGEVLLAVMIFLVPFLVPAPFYGLEMFVGLIQAFVFAMLALVFSKMATVHH